MDANETKIYFTVIICSIIIGAILLFFIFSMIQQHRRNIALYKSKLEAEITTLENERLRVSADLHDELGPLLFTVKFKLSGIEAGPEDQQMLEQANTHLDDIIQRIRDISNDLMPGTLLRKGVAFAIEEFVDNIIKTTALKINFTHNNIGELPKEKAINLYRIALEIIHNTLKHANATLLKMDLSAKDDKLILVSVDDGVGFNYAAKKTGDSGLGLRNLLNRTELMNGDLYVESTPEAGTKYQIEIPLA